LLFEGQAVDPNPDAAVSGQDIPGIGDEIQNDLLNLLPVGVDAAAVLYRKRPLCHHHRPVRRSVGAVQSTGLPGAPER